MNKESQNDLPSLITYGEAAQKLGCSESTVKRMVREGLLCAVKLRGSRRVLADSIELLIKKQIFEAYKAGISVLGVDVNILTSDLRRLGFDPEESD